MKKFIIINSIGWILVIIILFWLHSNKYSVESIDKIDSLNSKVDSIVIIKDSIQERVDTLYLKIKDNNSKYEENFNTILNNNSDEDYKFFLKYINSNKSRFDSIGTSF